VPELNYQAHLFHERTLTSVEANTRADAAAFLAEAAAVPLVARAQPFPLAEANRALQLAKAGALTGAAVLLM
jgi:propanol-preferring alcohol dehydrogenase